MGWCLTVPCHYLDQCSQRNKLTCKGSVEQILFEKKSPLKEKHLKCRVFCSDLNISVHCLRQQCLHCAGFEQFIFQPCVFRVRYLIFTDLQCLRSVVEPEMYLLGLFGPRALWGSWPATLDADPAPVPLTVFRSDSEFERSLGFFGLGCARPIVGRFCTRCDCYTVVACAKFRCDRWDTFWAGARHSFVGFRVRSGYRWWDGRQSCEICPCTSILMTKISIQFLFLLYACCIMSCHVMLAINCTKIEKLNWKLNWKYIMYGQNARYLFHMATV